MGKDQSKRDIKKQQKKSAIIEAAEELFLMNGYEHTSLDDVSRKVVLTKRTIYQYFTSKEDLFFAVAQKGVIIVNSYFDEAILNGRSGLEKIRLASKALLRFYKDYPELFRLLNYKPSRNSGSESSINRIAFEGMQAENIHQYTEFIKEGISDGSIDPLLDVKKAVHFGFISTISLMNMVSSLPKLYWAANGLDEYEFIEFSLDLLSDALR